MQPMRYSLHAGVALLSLSMLAATSGTALARPDSLAMTCSQTAGLVAKSNGIVIGTGPNIYDRYVASRASCMVEEQLKPAWVKTRDNPQCFIGYTCYVPTRDNFFR